MSLTKNIEEMEEKLKEELGEKNDDTGDDSESGEERGEDADTHDHGEHEPEKGVEVHDDNASRRDREEPKEDEKSPAKNDLTDAERARIRVLERQNRELQEQLKQPKETKEEPKETKEEPKETKEEPKNEAPNKEEDYEGWLEWNSARLENEIKNVKDYVENNPVLKRVQERELEEAEIRGFTTLEKRFKSTVDDYEDVSSFGARVIYNSIRALNPGISQERAADATKRQLLTMANNFLEQGFEDPIKMMYQTFKEQYGYQPKAKEAEKETKPDLKKIADAKKKSASPASGGRNANAGLSATDFSKMSLAEKAKLSPAQVKELLENV